MRIAATRSVAAVLVGLLVAAGCSMPNPLAGAAIEGSTHGGWGAPRPAQQAEADSAGHAGEEAVAEAPAVEPVLPARDVADAAPSPAIEQPAAAAPPAPARQTPRREAADARPEERARESRTATTPDPPARAGATSSAPAVTRVSFAERADGRGLVVRLHTTGAVPAHKVEEVSDGRLQLTMFQTEIRDGVQRDDPRGSVRHYSLHSADGRTTLILDVEPDIFYERQPYRDRDSHDLLLPLVSVPRPVASAQPVATSSNGGADAASQARWRFDCIVIDPGHGGRDPGATANGIRESDVNLAIARRLGRLVEENLGVRVVYTRTDDRFVELAERGRIANKSCGKLFVSIHANSASNRSARGTETYFLGVHRSESARRVMERENSVIALESDPGLYSGMDEAALIMQTMAQSTYLRVSEQLASLIENQFTSTASRNSRGVKQAGFLVLWRASMPAVLVETGFITNPQEARFLGSAAGQEQMAYSIYRAIREFKEQYERGLGIAVKG